MQQEKLELIAENLEKLVTIENWWRPGVIHRLYEAARKVYGEPLILRAARELKDSVGREDVVLIITGFRVPPLYLQETDGPLGAASLARAVSLGLEAIPIIITDHNEQSISIVESACRGIGLSVTSLNTILKEKPKKCTTVIGFPIKREEAKEKAKEIIDITNPKALIFIEKAGANVKGEYHTARGLNITNYHSKVEYLLEEAQRRKILSIGIGDGGNEVGMGVIEEAVRKFVPYGAECQCPCRGGIAAHSKTDVLVVSTTSNWGAYAISALLAKMLNKYELLHEPQHEDLMLTLAIDKGAIDGSTGLSEKSVDSIKLEIHQALLKIMHTIIRGG